MFGHCSLVTRPAGNKNRSTTRSCVQSDLQNQSGVSGKTRKGGMLNESHNCSATLPASTLTPYILVPNAVSDSQRSGSGHLHYWITCVYWLSDLVFTTWDRWLGWANVLIVLAHFLHDFCKVKQVYVIANFPSERMQMHLQDSTVTSRSRAHK